MSMTPSVPLSSTAKPEHLATQALRVLVAEDQSLLAADIRAMLEDMGHEPVGPVGDGQAAVEAARAERPDLVLMDINMPRRDGISAGKIIFTELNIPVVLLTAYSQAEHVKGARETDAFGYVVKPASPDQLRVAIDVAYARFLQVSQDRTTSIELRRRIDERRITERAKWILVERKGLSEPEAWSLMQRTARAAQRKLLDVANEIIAGQGLLIDPAAKPATKPAI